MLKWAANRAKFIIQLMFSDLPRPKDIKLFMFLISPEANKCNLKAVSRTGQHKQRNLWDSSHKTVEIKILANLSEAKWVWLNKLSIFLFWINIYKSITLWLLHSKLNSSI